MAVSALTGILIATGAGSAVVNYFTGRSQAKAAEQAADTQVEGTREARDYAEPLYAEAQRVAKEQHDRAQAVLADQYSRGQATLAPYAQAGTSGLTALSQYLGVPVAAAPTAAAPMAAPVMAPAPVAAAPPPTGSVPLTDLVNGRGVPVSLLSQLTTTQIAEANRATGGAFLGGGGTRTTAPATQTSYVTLRAPTGETRPVPADQVAFYLARGATRV